MRNRRQRIIIAIIVAAFLVVAGLLIAMDFKGVRQVLNQARWQLSLAAVAFSLLSDFCLSYDYALINKAFSINIGQLDSLQIGFVSSAANNILAFMGAAGHSIRVVLIRRKGIESGEIIAASIFHSYINNITMLALLLIGLLLLIFRHVIYGGNLVGVILVVIILSVLLAIFTVMIVIQRLRRWVLNISSKVWHFFSHRNITTFTNNLDSALGRGLEALKTRHILLIIIFLMMAAQWVFAVISLWFCFYALGKPPGPGVLISGFGVGISAGNLSMLPGGLGVQEASMAAVFALMGISIAQAALASILFRVTNNFVPFLISLALYGTIIRRRGRQNDTRR
jgi:uncharacterized protein (TIRG00374 family)